MDKGVRLVFLPGSPCTLKALCPKSQFLTLQSRLIAQGIPCDMVDFGVLEEPSLYSKTSISSTIGFHSGWARQHKSGWGGIPVLHKIMGSRDHEIPEMNTDQWMAQLEADAPSVFVFWIDDRAMYHRFAAYGGRLHETFPEAKILLAGSHARHFVAYALHDYAFVRGVIVGDLFQSLLKFLALADDIPQDPHSIQGMVLRAAVEGSVPSKLSEKALAPGYFSKNRLQSRVSGIQFPLFYLGFSHQPQRFIYQEEKVSLSYCKSAELLLDEIIFLQKHHKAHAFHIDASHVSASHLAKFADLLLNRDLTIIYALGNVSEAMEKSLADRLFASGCRSIGFCIPTGSQRILEDFYGCSFSISAMCAGLQRCRKAGIFTVVHVCYPCPLDDYHTRAETERFLELAQPKSVCMDMPALVPGSKWFRRPSEFGFLINHQEYIFNGSASPVEVASLPYTMRGWNVKRIIQARDAMAESLMKLDYFIDVTEEQGLLARLLRHQFDESDFLQSLTRSLTDFDVDHLSGLAAYLADSLQRLDCDDLEDMLPGKAVSFS
ncbi:MAG: hypothetical protein ACOYI9_11090 [Candidatus Hydrogenedentales bacterium]|jgi:hypothetical protein